MAREGQLKIEENGFFFVSLTQRLQDAGVSAGSAPPCPGRQHTLQSPPSLGLPAKPQGHVALILLREGLPWFSHQQGSASA